MGQKMYSPVILNLFHFSRCTRNTFTSKFNSSFKIFRHLFSVSQILNFNYQISVLAICFWYFSRLATPHLCSAPLCHAACLLLALSNSSLAAVPGCANLPNALSSSTYPFGTEGAKRDLFFPSKRSLFLSSHLPFLSSSFPLPFSSFSAVLCCRKSQNTFLFRYSNSSLGIYYSRKYPIRLFYTFFKNAFIYTHQTIKKTKKLVNSPGKTMSKLQFLQLILPHVLANKRNNNYIVPVQPKNPEEH